MEPGDISNNPIFRMLVFLVIAGVFFFRDYPKPDWKPYLGLPLYWLFILFFGYYSISGMIAAGVSELFESHADSDALSPTLVDQLTITSLGLLFLYRLFSRYIGPDESTRWAAEFVKGIATSYLAFNALFYAFANYLDNTPQFIAFSGTRTACVVLLVVFVLDVVFWAVTRKDEKSRTLPALREPRESK